MIPADLHIELERTELLLISKTKNGLDGRFFGDLVSVTDWKRRFSPLERHILRAPLGTQLVEIHFINN